MAIAGACLEMLWLLYVTDMHKNHQGNMVLNHQGNMVLNHACLGLMFAWQKCMHASYVH